MKVEFPWFHPFLAYAYFFETATLKLPRSFKANFDLFVF